MREYIKSYPNFPIDGIDYKDVASLCASQDGFAAANNFLYSNLSLIHISEPTRPY